MFTVMAKHAAALWLLRQRAQTVEKKKKKNLYSTAALQSRQSLELMVTGLCNLTGHLQCNDVQTRVKIIKDHGGL